MFHFTSLLGSQPDSPAVQSLLELDNSIKILINVGWDSTFSPALLAALEHHTPTIDLILLTHPTLEHMGAYAHACKHIPGFAAIPVYSTFPVSNLGRLLLQDMYLSTPAAYTRVRDHAGPEDEFTTKQEVPMDALMLPPTPAEIDGYCGRIVTLKYSQPTPLHGATSRVAGKLGSLTITAYSAGHSLGGTIWKIQQGQESIVYAVDWNLSRENCLRGAAFLGGGGGRVQEALAQPTALVCSARNAEVTNMGGGRKKRDEMLLETIRKTALEGGGTVLIPTDSVGRVLELAYLLEHAWRNDEKLSGKNRGVGLYLAGRKVKRLSQVVGSMLEWMDEAVVREFEAIAEASAKGDKKTRRDARRGGDGDPDDGKSADTGNKAGPFDFLHLGLVSSPTQLNKILTSNDGRGKVIIASDSSLEWGLGRDSLLKIANDPRNMVILTDRPDGRPTLSGTLYDAWQRASQTEAPGDRTQLNATTSVTNHNKLPLTGDELVSYQRHLTTSTTAQQTLLNAAPASLEDPDADTSESESESDSEQQGKSLINIRNKQIPGVVPGLPAPAPVDIGVNILLKAPGVYDFDVRGQKGRNRMFPFQVRRKRVDEYGEVVRPDDYLRAEERTDADAPPEPVAPSRVIGKKRKWETSAPSKPSAPNAETNKTSKRQRRNTRGSMDRPANDTDDEGDEEASDSETEPEEALQTPTKLCTHKTEVTLRLTATFIDFSGLHDEKALRMLLPLIAPKKLILTAATPRERGHLATFYRTRANASDSGTAELFAPDNGVTVDASVDTNAWGIRLTPALTRSLKWQHVRGLGVVHVVGRIVPPSSDQPEEQPDPKKQKLINDIPSLSAPAGEGSLALDLLPPSIAAQMRTMARPIHVGDIRLADLRRVLLEGGHVAEFKGEGTLLVDGCVVVRKRGVGRVVVEDGGGVGVRKGGKGVDVGGGSGGSFAEVRRRVYEGLAVVAGG